AHPKVCPVTGELIAFSYLSPEPPFLHYIRIGADGTVQQLEGIDIPNMVMMHDFNVTQNYVVFMDLPVCFDLGALETGMPFLFNRDAGARLGVMPRHGTNADVRWFEIDPCYVFHPVNAHESGNRIVLHVSRQPEAFGSSNDDYAEVGRLWRWTIDLDLGTVTEEQIDDRPGDFGRVNDRFVGLDAQFGYLMAMAGEGNSEEPVYGSALWKYDLRTGACVEHQLGDGVRGAEPVFAEAVGGGPDGAGDSAGEDEGWVISLIHDTVSDESRLIIVDAQNFSAPPVATIHLPRRVPYGAHGTWVADRHR
ncbi:MAG: carotenoid oxygenase family protein, partial [Ilumatobacteraceae bacterium]